jgi:hypothetical protein
MTCGRRLLAMRLSVDDIIALRTGNQGYVGVDLAGEVTLAHRTCCGEDIPVSRSSAAEWLPELVLEQLSGDQARYTVYDNNNITCGMFKEGYRNIALNKHTVRVPYSGKPEGWQFTVAGSKITVNCHP